MKEKKEQFEKDKNKYKYLNNQITSKTEAIKNSTQLNKPIDTSNAQNESKPSMNSSGEELPLEKQWETMDN